ncbi:hypothetical protein MBLNU230_g7547t1 [Neophaeotheca triangularis]
MFETTWAHASSQVLPPNTSREAAIRLLHDFDGVMRLNPDCKSTRPIEPKNGMAKNAVDGQQFYEVEDAISFLPSAVWSGTCRYTAAFLRLKDGCDIVVYAPGGFTSVNHWRLVRDTNPGATQELEKVPVRNMFGGGGTGESEWRVEIVSDCRCSKVYASFVKGFIKNSHDQLEKSYIEKLQQLEAAGKSRPGVPRRRSSWPMQ